MRGQAGTPIRRQAESSADGTAQNPQSASLLSEVTEPAYQGQRLQEGKATRASQLPEAG